MIKIEEKAKERLKKVLLSIASQDANEVLKWTSEQIATGKAKMSKKTAQSISSMKIKASKDALDCEVKFHDKLKAIELYFKLCGIDTSVTDGALYIDYGYISPNLNEDEN